MTKRTVKIFQHIIIISLSGYTYNYIVINSVEI